MQKPTCSALNPQMRHRRRGLRLFEPVRRIDAVWDLYLSVFGAPALNDASDHVEDGDRQPVPSDAATRRSVNANSPRAEVVA